MVLKLIKIKSSVLINAGKIDETVTWIKIILRPTIISLVTIVINLLMLIEIKIGSIVHMNVISRIGSGMNNEFEFYTSYIFFLKLKNERIITNKEIKKSQRNL